MFTPSMINVVPNLMQEYMFHDKVAQILWRPDTYVATPFAFDRHPESALDLKVRMRLGMLGFCKQPKTKVTSIRVDVNKRPFPIEIPTIGSVVFARGGS